MTENAEMRIRAEPAFAYAALRAHGFIGLNQLIVMIIIVFVIISDREKESERAKLRSLPIKRGHILITELTKVSE